MKSAKGKVERFASKKAMALHEKGESKKVVDTEKKAGERDVVIRKASSTAPSKKPSSAMPKSAKSPKPAGPRKTVKK